MIIWLGHLRVLVHCVIVCKFGNIQGFSAVHAAAGRESLAQERMLVIHLCLDTQGGVSGWFFILFGLLSLSDIAK